jgi:glycosyltransferase involved in cell wall biosynthesis
MRLLMIAPLLGGSGRVPDVFETLGPLLRERDHDVVMGSQEPGSFRRAAAMAGLTVRSRRSVDAVVIHLYSGRALVVEDAVSRLAGDRPLVGVLSGGGFPTFAQRHPRWVRRVLDRFDRLVAPSPYLARWASSQSATPVTVIANPLDLTGYPRRTRTAVRPRLLWLRAYHPIYAPEVAVRALAELVRALPDAELTMVGDDKGERAGVESLARELGVDARVTIGGFAGPAEKHRLFDDHDVFVNTSRVDNRPVSVVEAAGCGLCVVSTRVGGIPDLVVDGESALLVDPDAPEAIAGAVRRLVEDPSLAEQLSVAGQAVADAGRPERVVAAWEAVLGELV